MGTLRAHIALRLAYEGTRYQGFQRQPGRPTIQGELEWALQRLTGCLLKVRAASRTDAGAHAEGQVVSFVTEAELPLVAYLGGLNRYLPEEVMVQAVAWVEPDFDPRRWAQARHYRYTVFQGPAPSPRWRRWSLWLRGPLDVAAMAKAAQALVGERDFSPFVGGAGGRQSALGGLRRLYEVRVAQEGHLITFDMVGNSFLPHQVRHLVGALVAVGRGRLSLSSFAELVAGRWGRWPTAVPAPGLCLMRVDYGDREPQWRTGA